MERNYECLLIIANDKSEEARGALVKKFSDMAGKTSVEKWGLRKFATPINYKKDGYYFLLNFVASTDTVAKMTALMNITDGIERYMFTVKDEKMIEADKARKAKRAEAKANATKTEEPKGE